MSLTDSGTVSPRDGGALSKLRSRSKGLASASTSSLASSGGDGDGDDAQRRSGESPLDPNRLFSSIDKVRDRRRRSIQEDRRNSEDTSGRRLSTFVSNTKRKIKRDRGQDDERTLSADSAWLDDQSDSSLLDGSGRSTLLTDDERLDPNNTTVSPSLSSYPSHSGYLTHSSPELNVQTSALIDGSSIVASPEAVPTRDPFANIPAIVEHRSSSDGGPTELLPARSPSPSGRLRERFALPRKKSTDTDSAKSGGLGGLFKSSSRRNSLVERPASEPQRADGTAPVGQAKNDLGTAAVTDVKGERQIPETPQHAARQSINTKLPATPPNLVDTPTTLVTPPTPTDVFTFRNPSSPAKGSPNPRPNSIESIRHRRAQSANLPSRLSTSTNAPLTPTAEEYKTPGGTLTQPSLENASGFFTSFFSAAQKAAGQASSSINTLIPNQKSKATSTPQTIEPGGEEVIPGEESTSGGGALEDQRKPLAVETLGKGNLDFSHLGIASSESNPPSSAMDSTVASEGVEDNGSDSARKVEEEAAARAVSSAYDKPIASGLAQPADRPLSIASNERLALAGDQTPPRSATVDTESYAIKRSGSVRSKLSGRRKHRGSSATAGTNNSLAAAILQSTTGLANPGAHGPGHRMTGFAVATSKRNKDFHQLFRSVPEDDYLIEDYSAALQRDILLHGRLYVSEGHVCFSSNILGWVTNLVISFDEVVSVEKKSTAVIFPNAIVISTLNARNTFASFVARDSTYELLIGIWKISHPNLKSSLNGVTLDNAGTGDRTEVAEPEEEAEDDEDGSSDEVYDEDAGDDEGSFTDGGFGASDAGSNAGDMTLSRRTSAVPVAAASQPNGTVPKGLENADAAVVGAAVSSEFPGTTSHEPTECSESGEHYDRPLADTTIPAPLGQVYSIMFGPASGAFMRKWLVEDQKSRDLNFTDDKTGLDNDHKTFTFDYIKPLSNPMGPRQTKCITTNTLKAFDLERAVSVDCSTVTPDVPSGNGFTTKTRYCLMWGSNNSTRMIASCTIEWTAKSWLKGAIEKGANDGQIEYLKSITAAIKAAVTAKPPVKGQPKKGKRKGKREVFDAEEAVAQREAAIAAADQRPPDWGLLEPLHPVFEPLLALIRPFANPQVAIAVLFALLAYTWLFSSRTAAHVGYPGLTSPDRLVAYEEIWRREESALWDWIEDRVGVEGVYSIPSTGKQDSERQRMLTAKSMGKQLTDEKMTEKQIDDAIRTTEKKLAALKEAVSRKKRSEKNK